MSVGPARRGESESGEAVLHLVCLICSVGEHETPSGRELNQQKGRDYADAAVRFMDTRGYICTDRAEVSGSTTDLEFKPKVSGRPIIAEAKYRGQNKDGLSPKKYKEGFAKYFIRWADEPEYEFHFFISKESNPSLWQKLFREDPDSEEVEDYFDQLQEEVGGELGERLSKYDVETFEDFAADTTIWNWDYIELTREADRAERVGDLDYEPYLTAYPPIEDGEGRLFSNLFEVTQYPSTIYRWATKDGVSHSSFYGKQENQHIPVELGNGYLYSLLAPNELHKTASEKVIGEPEQLQCDKLIGKSDDETVNLVKSLLRGLITHYASNAAGAEIGERRDGRVTVIYMPLRDPANQNKEVINSRWLAKKADGHNVVRHRAIEVRVKRFAGQYYYAFMPRQEFTTDGKSLVSADYKSRLVDDFPHGRFPQNDRKRKNITVWGDVLNPGESVVAYSTINALRELEFNQVGDIQTDYRPPTDGDERSEHIEKL